MKNPLLTVIAMVSTSAAIAQNSVTINQAGDREGNRAVVSQSGSGNSVVINQSSSSIEENKRKENRKSRPGEGNQISLRVDANTQTTINQHNSGPNSVELWQDGNSSTTINQSSGTHENSVVTHPPLPEQPTRKNRSSKRRN